MVVSLQECALIRIRTHAVQPRPNPSSECVSDAGGTKGAGSCMCTYLFSSQTQARVPGWCVAIDGWVDAAVDLGCDTWQPVRV